MQVLKTEVPILVNKTIVTLDILNELAMLQAFGKEGWSHPVYDNEGLKMHISYLDESIAFVMQNMSECSLDYDFSGYIEMLRNLSCLRSTLKSLLVPESVIKQMGFKNR